MLIFNRLKIYNMIFKYFNKNENKTKLRLPTYKLGYVECSNTKKNKYYIE